MSNTKEWDAGAQFELKAHPHPPSCLFSDITGFLKTGLQYILKDMQNGDRLLSDLQPLILSDRAVNTYLPFFCYLYFLR